MRPGFVRKYPKGVAVGPPWAAGCRVCGAVYHYRTWHDAVRGMRVHLDNNLCGTLWSHNRH